MRKEDIIVTTPKKSIIYAVGTRPENNEKVWGKIDDNWDAKPYLPAYVLEVLSTGHANILQAEKHPDSRYAKEQATPLEALDYTIADRDARREVMAAYSHWPLSAEQTAEKNEKLAALKPLPKGWKITTIRTTDVRLLWADYATRHAAAVAEYDAKQKAAKEEAESEKTRKERVIKKLAKLKVGIKKKDVPNLIRYSGKTIYLPVEVLEKLVEGYSAE